MHHPTNMAVRSDGQRLRRTAEALTESEAAPSSSQIETQSGTIMAGKKSIGDSASAPTAPLPNAMSDRFHPYESMMECMIEIMSVRIGALTPRGDATTW
jgi:hypothetical protein